MSICCFRNAPLIKVCSLPLFPATQRSTKPSSAPSVSASSRAPSQPASDAPATPPKVCQQQVVLIPDQNDETTVARYFVKPETPYKPTDVNPGSLGVSFPTSDKAYIVIFPLATPAVIRAVRVPEASNVDQIRIMFLDNDDKPLSAQPTDNTPLQLTSTVGKSPRINVDFAKKVKAVHVTLIHTKDGQAPQGVTVEIIACVEPVKTTPRPPVSPSKKPTRPHSNHTSPPKPCKNRWCC